MNNRTVTALTVVIVTLMLAPVACVDHSSKQHPELDKWSGAVATSFCSCAESEDPQPDVDTVPIYDTGIACDELACGDQEIDGSGGISCGGCRGHEQVCVGQDDSGFNGYCAVPYQMADADGLSGYNGTVPCGGPGQVACMQAPDPSDPDTSPIFFCLAPNLYLYGADLPSTTSCNYLTPAVPVGGACVYNSDCAGAGLCNGGVCQ